MLFYKRILVSVVIFWIAGCSAEIKNGFDLTGALVPVDQVLSGGPAKDGIPAIDAPRFVSAGQATFMNDAMPVLGVTFNGQSKAYPVNILNWHEIVNDRFQSEPVVVTFCPLCNSGMAFSALIDGKPHTFGVSGLLYNSDVLMFDRQTESLWSQLQNQAVSGRYQGRRLKPVPVVHTTWRDWQTRHPDTLVLSTDTGHRRAYDQSPYADYLKSPQIMFPVNAINRRYHPKEDVLGLELDGHVKVYPFIELTQANGEITDQIGERKVTIRFDAKNRSGAIYDDQGKLLPAVRTFWFAWYAFHPEGEVYQAEP